MTSHAIRRGAPRFLVGVGLALLLAVSTTVAKAEADKIVATVNVDNITQDEFYQRLQRVHGQDFLVPTNPPSLRGEPAGYIVLNSLINERLILQLAAKSNLAANDADVTSELELYRKQENIRKALADHVVTESDLKYDIRVQRGRFNLATNGATISDAEVEDYYNKHKVNYTLPERWRLSTIRTSKQDNLFKVQADLRAGKNFPDVARQYSEDERTSGKGGDAGYFLANDSALPDAIRRAVKVLTLGEVTAPIPIEFDPGAGKEKIKVWWVVKLTEKTPEIVRALSDIKPQLQRVALLEKVGGMQEADKRIGDFRGKSDIKVNLPGYEALLNPSAKP
jgi:parvulin-like peptidyl-prolyl isomerase